MAKHRHFLSLNDYSSVEIKLLLDSADELKKHPRRFKKALKGKILAMIFEKSSTRTRVSFEAGMQRLGGVAQFLSSRDIQLGRGEPISDTAAVLSRYVDGIMARTFAHQTVLDLARFGTVPVVNGLSDFSHPCQAMADALTIIEKFGAMKGLNVTYVGDGNNVAVSLMHISVMLGANFSIANPAGYDMPAVAQETGAKLAKASGAKITYLRDAHEAVKGAQIIYTDTWTSMGQEEETAKREAIFPPYQINSQLVAEADRDVIVMHCLPAHRGEEITDEVLDGPNSVAFPQAGNRMHAQKALLLWAMDS